MKNKWLILISICALLIAAICYEKEPNNDVSIETHDLSHIKKRGELTILTLNSSLSYFNYRGEEMGFQYELAKKFADYLGVKLKVKIAKNTSELVDMLKKGEGDLIAYNLPLTKEFKDSLTFCGEEVITHQVLVQRTDKDSLITNVTQLIGKEIDVNQPKVIDRLNNLDKELGGGIIIKPVENDTISSEDLIAKVSNGEINYTVCDNDLAQLNKTYYSNLNVNLAISFDQRSSWAVRKNSPELAEIADKWHKAFVNTSDYKESVRRYFEQNKSNLQHGSILSLKDGRISHYDHLFKRYAKAIDWDWRLLASLAYTESNFDSTAVSWAGAKGLMQLMPGTARKMGIRPGHEFNAHESIKAAAKYIAIMDKIFKNIPQPERTKFILASYNAGSGHIMDAMALAQKYGKKKYVWTNNVEKYILLKSKEEYYNDAVCKNGYFRGKETYNFVYDILNRYEVYKEKIKH